MGPFGPTFTAPGSELLDGLPQVLTAGTRVEYVYPWRPTLQWQLEREGRRLLQLRRVEYC